MSTEARVTSRPMLSRMTVFLLAGAQPAAAQFVGASLGRVSSTVDWQYPAPPSNCDACVVDVSPNASRQSFAPALLWQGAPARAVGFATEVRYTLKGYATTEPTLNVHYLEVPLLLRLGVLSAPGVPVRPFVEAGPAFASRVHCEVDYNGRGDDCARGAAFGQDWRVRHFDISGVIGAGLAVHVGNDVAIAGARYDYGFVNIGSTGQGVPTKNRSSLVYLAWLWPVRALAP
jgi:hypothetical protein